MRKHSNIRWRIVAPLSLLTVWVGIDLANRHAVSLDSWLAHPHSDAQGDRIVLNGRTTNGYWKRQDGAIWVTDLNLMQTIGLELLSSNDPTQQPVQWFSEQSDPSPIPSATVHRPFRYLDITDLAQHHQWRLRSQGGTLSIETPSAEIRAIRHGRQPWGDRLVVDLDYPTPFQVHIDASRVSITLDAQQSAMLDLPLASQTHTVDEMQTITERQHTTLNLTLNNREPVKVWTVPTPPRMIVDIGIERFSEKHIHWLPGLWWHQQQVSMGQTEFPLVALELLPGSPSRISLRPIWANPDGMEGIQSLPTIAQQWGAIAAINGGFFNRNNHLPLGAIRQGGQWYSGPILNRGAIAWTHLGDIHMGRLRLQETIRLSTGQAFPSQYLDSGYVQAGLSRYTPRWGTHYTPLTDFETLVTVQNGQIIDQQRIDDAGSRPIPIPSDGYLLTARSYQTAANALVPGTELQVEAIAQPSVFDTYTNILGAGPLLIHNGEIVLDAESEGFSEAFIQQRAPRSAIAQTSSGSLLIVTIPSSGRRVGPTLSELAHILNHLDVQDAINLDGGNSSSLYLGGRLLTPANQSAARIHNGIGIFMDANSVNTE